MNIYINSNIYRNAGSPTSKNSSERNSSKKIENVRVLPFLNLMNPVEVKVMPTIYEKKEPKEPTHIAVTSKRIVQKNPSPKSSLHKKIPIWQRGHDKNHKLSIASQELKFLGTTKK